MRKAIEWALGEPELDGLHFQPSLILLAGFSGALQSGLEVGHLVLATEIVEHKGGQWPATWPGPLPPGEWRPPLVRGRLLTVDTLANDPTDKRALGQRFDALAVDMESAAAAQLCHEHGVPFGCLRAISDAVDKPLSPALVALLSAGRPSPWRLLGAVLRKPHLLAELYALARATRSAAHRLAAALGELLTLTLPNDGSIDDAP